jgi:ATP/maltotriose-dependent transcriptional regulator MalT
MLRVVGCDTLTTQETPAGMGGSCVAVTCAMCVAMMVDDYACIACAGQDVQCGAFCNTALDACQVYVSGYGDGSMICCAAL